ISVQRVIAHPAVSGDFLDALVPRVEAIKVGDPSSPETGMGTLISAGEAERVRRSIAAAAAAGARVLTGGERDGSMVAPAVVAGSIHINWTPLWRADLMPYGGLKGSGIGKEGPRWAVEEMTELKTVILHGRPW